MLSRLVLLSLIAVIFCVQAKASDTEEPSPSDAAIPISVGDLTNIRIGPAVIGDQDVEVVDIPGEAPFVIPVMLPPSSKDLTPQEILEVRRAAREMTAVALGAFHDGDPHGAIRMDEQTFLEQLFAFNHEAYKPIPKDLPRRQKIGRVLKMVWQFVIVETLHALKDYGRDWWRAKSRFREFGFTVNVKIETQLFLAKLNPTAKWLKKVDPERHFKHAAHNHALYFGIAYNFKEHRLMIKKNYRREKGSGGFGAPAFKAEIRTFQSDGHKGPYHGVSLYPISPPFVSLIFDKSVHYFSQGITVGLNGGDAVPFSTLTNTFINYVHVDHDYHDSYNAFVDAAHFAREHIRAKKTACAVLLEEASALDASKRQDGQR